MKKPLKNEIDVVELINKVQGLLIVLDKKVDTLINRSTSEPRPSLKPAIDNTRHDHNRERVMHKAICADCKKECAIPFKPSGDRPVYCQDCFSRRKVISMSGMTVVDKSKGSQPVQTQVKTKAAPVKKPVSKKKPAPKKK